MVILKGYAYCALVIMLLPSLKEEKLGLNGSDVSASLFSAKFFLLAKAQLAGVVGRIQENRIER